MSALLIGLATTLVFCAPGYPGAAQDAQPVLDSFAREAAAAAHWPAGELTALYDPTEEGGLEKLASPQAALAFVPYPFFVRHATRLHLVALAQADVTGVGATQRWTLMAKRGRVSGSDALSGYRLLSVAGYAPEFVRGVALARWKLPEGTKIEPTGQILGVLRRIVGGEAVAALLDQEQTTASASLPFASELQALVQSPPLPVALLAVVDARVPEPRATALRTALVGLSRSSAGAAALEGLRLRGFISPQLPAAAP
jgi:hypothetical protein